MIHRWYSSYATTICATCAATTLLQIVLVVARSMTSSPGILQTLPWQLKPQRSKSVAFGDQNEVYLDTSSRSKAKDQYNMNMEYHVIRPVNHAWRLTNEFPNQEREDEGWMVLKECERMSVDSHDAPSPPPPIPLNPPLLFCRAGSGLCPRKILQQLDCGTCARAPPTYHRRGSNNIWRQTHSQRIHQSLALSARLHPFVIPLNTNSTIHQILYPGSSVLWQEVPTKTAGKQPCLCRKVPNF